MKRLILAIVAAIGIGSTASADGWRHHEGRWYFYNQDQVFFYSSPTAYYWWTGYEWVPVERSVVYATPYFSSYGFYSPYRGYHYHDGRWHRDDGRGGHERPNTDPQPKTSPKTGPKLPDQQPKSGPMTEPMGKKNSPTKKGV